MMVARVGEEFEVLCTVKVNFDDKFWWKADNAKKLHVEQRRWK